MHLEKISLSREQFATHSSSSMNVSARPTALRVLSFILMDAVKFITMQKQF